MSKLARTCHNFVDVAMPCQAEVICHGRLTWRDRIRCNQVLENYDCSWFFGVKMTQPVTHSLLKFGWQVWRRNKFTRRGQGSGVVLTSVTVKNKSNLQVSSLGSFWMRELQVRDCPGREKGEEGLESRNIWFSGRSGSGWILNWMDLCWVFWCWLYLFRWWHGCLVMEDGWVLR